MRDLRAREDDAEDEQVDAEQDERVQQRPEDAEQRALVLRLEVAAKEVREELAVAKRGRRRPSSAATSVGTHEDTHSPNSDALPSDTREHRRGDRRSAGFRGRDLGSCCATPLARRLVALPSRRPLARRPHPALRRRRHLRRASASGSGLAVAVRRVRADRADRRHLRRHRARLRRRPRRRPARAPPDREARAQIAAAVIVLATGTHVQLVHTHIVARRDRDGLAGRDDERVQPARQHGRARGDARRRSRSGSSRSTPSRSTRTTRMLAFALAGALRVRRLPAVQPPPGPQALVFMGDSGSQMLGFALAALGLAASWNVAGTTVATLVLPILILAVPILDTTLVTIGAPARRPADLTRAAATTRRTGSSASACPRSTPSLLLALIATAHRRLEPRVQRARQPALHDRRRRRHVRAARPVRELPRRRRAPARAGAASRAARRGVRRALAAPRRGARRLRRDRRLVRGRVRDRVRLAGHDEPAPHRDLDAAGRCSPRATSRSSRSASTARSGATPARATSARSPRAVVVSEVVALGVHGADAGHAATSHARSSSSTR